MLPYILLLMVKEDFIHGNPEHPAFDMYEKVNDNIL